MRYLILIILLCCLSCQTKPKKDWKTGWESTTPNQKAITDAASNLDADAEIIKTENQKYDNSQIDIAATDVQINAEKLRGQAKALAEKEEASKKARDASEKRLGELEEKLKKSESKGAWLYTLLYVGMIGAGALGIAGGIGWTILAKDFTIGPGVAGTSLTLVILGLTLQEYGCWIALGGFGMFLGLIVYAAYKLSGRIKDQDKQIKKDHHTKRLLVQSTQTALENDPHTALQLMKQHTPEALKPEIKELKILEGLGNPVTIPLKEVADVPAS